MFKEILVLRKEVSFKLYKKLLHPNKHSYWKHHNFICPVIVSFHFSRYVIYMLDQRLIYMTNQSFTFWSSDLMISLCFFPPYLKSRLPLDNLLKFKPALNYLNLLCHEKRLNLKRELLIKHLNQRSSPFLTTRKSYKTSPAKPYYSSE